MCFLVFLFYLWILILILLKNFNIFSYFLIFFMFSICYKIFSIIVNQKKLFSKYQNFKKKMIEISKNFYYLIQQRIEETKRFLSMIKTIIIKQRNHSWNDRSRGTGTGSNRDSTAFPYQDTRTNKTWVPSPSEEITLELIGQDSHDPRNYKTLMGEW